MKLFNIGAPSSSIVLWRELVAFSLYRLFLTAMLFSAFYFKLPPEFLGQAAPELYGRISVFYLFTAVIFIGITLKKLGRFESSARIQLVLDVIFITLIINASGGLHTGLGLLLVVVVVAGGTLIPGRLSALLLLLQHYRYFWK